MKELSKEEQEKLLESKYIQDVTSRFVYFTAEFKELFYLAITNPPMVVSFILP